jgi:GTP-binding protein
MLLVFVDQVKIWVKAGDGGNGCVSFRREKYVPRGGPNGGDGGKGGDIWLQASGELVTLLDLKYQQHYRVKRAQHGRGKNQHGKDSPDMIIKVPCGTLVRDGETHEILADLTEEDQQVLVARGGRGGRGNAAFATPTHQAPRRAEEGKPGEEHWLLLELKLLADVGLVGFPNAGKSTLISRISSARPKIADYPFTTLSPHLGTVSWKEGRSFVVADIPGLIEGAHTGKGLGIQFLRHIERTTFLLYLVDIGESAAEDPVRSLEVLQQEIKSYSPGLSDKPFAVAATKTDIQGEGAKLSRLRTYCHRKKYDLLSISAVTGEGIEKLTDYLGRKVMAMRRQKG